MHAIDYPGYRLIFQASLVRFDMCACITFLE